MQYLALILATIFLIFAASCAGSLKPYQTERVEAGWESKANKGLQELPQPAEKIVAAV